MLLTILLSFISSRLYALLFRCIWYYWITTFLFFFFMSSTYNSYLRRPVIFVVCFFFSLSLSYLFIFLSFSLFTLNSQIQFITFIALHVSSTFMFKTLISRRFSFGQFLFTSSFQFLLCTFPCSTLSITSRRITEWNTFSFEIYCVRVVIVSFSFQVFNFQ